MRPPPIHHLLFTIQNFMEVSRLGLEPRTPALKGQCSTVELPAHACRSQGLSFSNPAADGQGAEPPPSFRTGRDQKAWPRAAYPNNLHQWDRTRKYQSAESRGALKLGKAPSLLGRGRGPLSRCTSSGSGPGEGLRGTDLQLTVRYSQLHCSVSPRVSSGRLQCDESGGNSAPQFANPSSIVRKLDAPECPLSGQL